MRTAVALSSAAVLLLAVPLLRGLISPSSPRVRPDLAELVTAVGTRRIVEPRVTGGFAYGALQPASRTRSGDPSNEDSPIELRSAALALEKRAQGSTDPVVRGAFGTALLLIKRSDSAVATLEEAARLAPKDPRLSSDLAAAYLVRSQDREQIEDVARAVGFAQRAAELDPALVEARFNLALSLEGLSLRSEATKAWNAYLETDRNSPWADEARRHIERLAESPEERWEKQRQEILAAERADDAAIRAATKRFPDTAYEHVENELVPSWADAWLSRDVVQATDIARRARLFGQALADLVGERMALDAAAAIEKAQSSGNRARADALAHAQQAFRKTRGLYEQDRVPESASHAREILPDLERDASPYAGWATLYLAIADYFRGDLDGSAKRLDPLLREALARGYATLAGRTLRMVGLIRMQHGELGSSLDSYTRAQNIFEKIGAQEDLAAIHSSLSENLALLGNAKEAWRHRRLALTGLPFARTPRRRQTILASTANRSRDQNMLDVALAFQNELLSSAQHSRREAAVFEGYLGRAVVYHLMGRDNLAAPDLDAAGRWLQRIPDKVVQQRGGAELNLARGEVQQNVDTTASLEALTDSLAFFRGSGMAQRLARIHLAMGRVRLAHGQPQAAEASFLEGIQVLERQRAQLPTGELRLEYFNLPWNLFDEMIDLQAKQPERSSTALNFAERARARGLLDSASGSTSTAVIDPASLSTRLPTGTVVVYYASLEKRLLTWLIQPGGVEPYEAPIASSDLAREALVFATAIQNGVSDQAARTSQQLFDGLIRPLTGALPPNARLIIVADGALHAVPFAALKDRVTGRYLIEDHEILFAPSATMLDRASARLHQLSAAPQNVLAVANPNLDAPDVEGLPDLTGAESEVQEIAHLYPNAMILTGRDATKRAFVDSAPRFDIVHFAGHSLANDAYPPFSRLLFARDQAGRSGDLFAHEIARLRLPQTELVVLASCRTGAGPVTKGEGAISLARPFLADGVPTVLATLWNVGDRASQVFFGAFYESLRRGAEPAEATRVAQLTLLKNSDPTLQRPVSWSGVVVLGGVKLNGGRR